MTKEGLLDDLIAAHLPRGRFDKGWTQKMDADYIRSVYSEITQLVKGFEATKQTTSEAKGFFAYIKAANTCVSSLYFSSQATLSVL